MDHANIQLGCRTEPVFYNVRRKSKTIGNHLHKTIDTPKAAVAEHGFSGIGIIIPKDMFFLDIDHKAVEDPFVQMLLMRFNSYAELSVSKEGVHILGTYDISRIPTQRDEKGRVRLDRRYYVKNPHNNLELYLGGLTNRFAVVTEDIAQDKPLADCTQGILTTLDKEMRRKTGTAGENAEQKSSVRRGGDAKVEQISRHCASRPTGRSSPCSSTAATSLPTAGMTRLQTVPCAHSLLSGPAMIRFSSIPSSAKAH
jgi:hypothetical protein